MLCDSKRPSSHCDIGFCRGNVLDDPRRPSFTNSFCNCCNIGIGRFLLSGPRRPAPPEDTAFSDSVEALCCAIPASAQNSARSLTCSWRSRAWSCAWAQPGDLQYRRPRQVWSCSSHQPMPGIRTMRVRKHL